jgi:ferredoxin, 2Fe-2S
MNDLLALCGGVCSCGTCHVHVDENFMPALAPMHEDESGVLAASSHRQANSRLSCQLRMSDELDGLRVTIAPED